MSKGPLTLMVENRTIKDILKCDRFIVLRYMDGTSHTIEWVDSNGRPVRGEPRMKTEGTHIIAKAPRLNAAYKPRNGVLVPDRFAKKTA